MNPSSPLTPTDRPDTDAEIYFSRTTDRVPPFRRGLPWSPSLPDADLAASASNGEWLHLAVAFNNRQVPVGYDGADLRLGTAPHWANPVAVLRHQGCGGILGTVLRIAGLTVLGVLDADRSYRTFEVLHIHSAPADPAALAAATGVIHHATCHRCRQATPLAPVRPALRSLPRHTTKTRTLRA